MDRPFSPGHPGVPRLRSFAQLFGQQGQRRLVQRLRRVARADAVYYAYAQPRGVCIREIVLAATRQQA